MKVTDAVLSRRSIKSFAPRDVPNDVVQSLLDLAVWAPNHRMTEPWRFVVLGVEAKRAYARIRGESKASKTEDPTAAEAVAKKFAAEIESVPAIVAFAQRLDERPDVREEDYATMWMAIQNVLLGAVEAGLGTHVKTGGDLDLPSLRAALGVSDDERIVAVVHLGEPADVRPAKPRVPATERVRWLP